MTQKARLKKDVAVPDGGYFYNKDGEEDYICPKGTEVEINHLKTFYDDSKEVIKVLYPNGVEILTDIDSLEIDKTIQLDRSLYFYGLEESSDDYDYDCKINLNTTKVEEQSTIDWEQRKWELYKIALMNNINGISSALTFSNRAIKYYKEDK